MRSLQWTDDPSSGNDSTHGGFLNPGIDRLNAAKEKNKIHITR